MIMNLNELESLLYNIGDIIDYVEKAQIDKSKTKIYLGNNEDISFSVPKESIPHLLGINTTYLASTNVFKSKNSFELIKEMCENPYRIHSLAKDGILNYDQLFSPYVFDKINIFKENIKINIFETEFVCKYEPTRSYMTTNNTEKYDYIIVKRYSDGRIGVLGIVKNEYTYVARSNQIYSDFETFVNENRSTMNNQEITLITGINIYNAFYGTSRPFKINIEGKLQKLQKMIDYKKCFNASIDVSSDFIYHLGLLENEKQDRYKRNDNIDEIVERIMEQELIDQTLIEDANLLRVVNAYNDSLCNKETNSESTRIAYSDAISELDKFKKLVEDLNITVTDLTKRNEELTNKVNELSEENTEYKEKEEKVLELLTKKPRM